MADYRERCAVQRRRRLLRRVRAAALMLLAAALLAGGVLAAVHFWNNKEADGDTDSLPSSSGSGQAALSGPQQGGQDIAQTDALSRWEEMASAGQTINNFSPLAPSRRLYALPQNGRVDLSYFDDAVFVGDSISTGWSVYKDAAGMLPSPNVVAEKGASPSCGEFSVDANKVNKFNISALRDALGDMTLSNLLIEESVSYTHLDVYKRQEIQHELRQFIP